MAQKQLIDVSVWPLEWLGMEMALRKVVITSVLDEGPPCLVVEGLCKTLPI